ncbi:VOC family protein, partial [Escherichia coli]
MRQKAASSLTLQQCLKKSIGFYCDKLGFTLVHHEDGFAVLMCNEVRIHLWEASDEG